MKRVLTANHKHAYGKQDVAEWSYPYTSVTVCITTGQWTGRRRKSLKLTYGTNHCNGDHAEVPLVRIQINLMHLKMHMHGDDGHTKCS